jgi:hypothetical protein
MRKQQPMSKQTLDLSFVRFWVLMPDAVTSHFAGEFMQIQGNVQSLFGSHGPIEFDLLLDGGFRAHEL